MKKLLALFTAVILAFSLLTVPAAACNNVNAAAPVPEGAVGFFFETNPVDGGWTWEDHDGDGFSWMWANAADDFYGSDWDYPEGLGCMNSESNVNYVGELTPDNWLISPEVPGGGSVSFMIVSQDPNYPGDPVGVYASADGGESWSGELGYFTASAEIQVCEVDLSGFAGQDIKLAFRHYIDIKQSSINLDAVIVTPAEESPRVPGDYDCNGKVNVQDAVLTLRAAMELITPSAQSLLNADMNENGALEVTDAITVLRMAMELI